MGRGNNSRSVLLGKTPFHTRNNENLNSRNSLRSVDSREVIKFINKLSNQGYLICQQCRRTADTCGVGGIHGTEDKTLLCKELPPALLNQIFGVSSAWESYTPETSLHIPAGVKLSYNEIAYANGKDLVKPTTKRALSPEHFVFDVVVRGNFHQIDKDEFRTQVTWLSGNYVKTAPIHETLINSPEFVEAFINYIGDDKKALADLQKEYL